MFALGRKGSCRLLSSRYAAVEAERNLREKTPGALKAFWALLAEVVLLPEADAQTLGRAAVLVTGDRKHCGRWMGKELLGVKIRGLAQALEHILV